jgi:hypothetical protein
VDVEAAYDSVNEDQLLIATVEFKISKKEKLTDLTTETLNNLRCRVKMYNDLSEQFTTYRGLTQADALACQLLKIALENVIRDSSVEKRGTIYFESTQILAYSGDIDILYTFERAVKEAFINTDKEAQKMGLRINETTTKFMDVTMIPTNTKRLKAGNNTIEKISEFKYLGILITSNNLNTEIQHILQLTNRCYLELRKQLSSHYTRISIKLKRYKTSVRQ